MKATDIAAAIQSKAAAIGVRVFAVDATGTPNEVAIRGGHSKSRITFYSDDKAALLAAKEEAKILVRNIPGARHAKRRGYPVWQVRYGEDSGCLAGHATGELGAGFEW